MKFKPLSWLMLALIAFYRTCISPLTPPACRYTPTCSQYAQEAIKKYGPFKGVSSVVTPLAGRDTTPCRNQSSLSIIAALASASPESTS